MIAAVEDNDGVDMEPHHIVEITVHPYVPFVILFGN